ncbi:MAG: glutathione S-transferase N-terminal domain-containing protein [Polyangiaceae bacterium]
MSAAPEGSDLALFGRSSSSFTRVARIDAAEPGVPYQLRVVPDLRSLEAAGYGRNPALRLPVLQTAKAPGMLPPASAERSRGVPRAADS